MTPQISVSSNGRTTDFDSVDRGSTPFAEANNLVVWHSHLESMPLSSL